MSRWGLLFYLKIFGINYTNFVQLLIKKEKNHTTFFLSKNIKILFVRIVFVFILNRTPTPTPTHFEVPRM